MCWSQHHIEQFQCNCWYSHCVYKWVTAFLSGSEALCPCTVCNITSLPNDTLPFSYFSPKPTSTGWKSFLIAVTLSLWAGIAQSVKRLATGWKVRGSNSGVRWDFPHPSRPAVGPTQPPIQCVRDLYRGESGWAWRWSTTPIYRWS